MYPGEARLVPPLSVSLILHIGWAFAHSANIYVLKMPIKQLVAQSHNYGWVQRC